MVRAMAFLLDSAIYRINHERNTQKAIFTLKFRKTEPIYGIPFQNVEFRMWKHCTNFHGAAKETSFRKNTTFT